MYMYNYETILTGEPFLSNKTVNLFWHLVTKTMGTCTLVVFDDGFEMKSMGEEPLIAKKKQFLQLGWLHDYFH